MNYHDCQITVSGTGVKLEINGNEWNHSTPFDRASLLCIQRLHYWMHHTVDDFAEDGRRKKQPSVLDDLKAIGWMLHNFLFAGDVRKNFDTAHEKFATAYKSASQKGDATGLDLRLRLHLVFDETARELAPLPWEFLFMPGPSGAADGFFFSGQHRELVLTRCVPGGAASAATEGKLKFLILHSSPSDLPQLGAKEAEELEGLISKLEALRSFGNVETTLLKNPTYDEVNALMIGPQEDWPHIVHFIGHGDFIERDKKLVPALAFCLGESDDDYEPSKHKDDPHARWVTSQEFRDLFGQNEPPRIVFLNACKGAASTSLDSLNSIARDLVFANVPAVIAMQYSIENRDARMFALRFYESLFSGATVDEAVKEGRVDLGNRAPKWQHPRFGTPVLYLKNSTTASPLTTMLPSKVASETAAQPGSRFGGQSQGNVPAALIDTLPAPSAPATVSPSQAADAAPSQPVTDTTPGTAAASALTAAASQNQSDG